MGKKRSEGDKWKIERERGGIKGGEREREMKIKIEVVKSAGSPRYMCFSCLGVK